MPLNQGALAPITIKIPGGSLLNPSETAAVVGGNVLTSQRLCDVILKAFKACAASQGCCNNFTFGMGGKGEDGEVTEGFGYYETIAGGSGAGPTWDGRSTSSVHRQPLFVLLILCAMDCRWCPHSYDQHPHHRPGNHGTPISGIGPRVWIAKWWAV